MLAPRQKHRFCSNGLLVVERFALQVLQWSAAPRRQNFTRAIFRMRMRGGSLSGPAYLLRLSFSPTEEDWVEGAENRRHWLLDALGRPFRLALKYGRDNKS
jgi:hypothetical protein